LTWLPPAPRKRPENAGKSWSERQDLNLRPLRPERKPKAKIPTKTMMIGGNWLPLSLFFHGVSVVNRWSNLRGWATRERYSRILKAIVKIASGHFSR
jgi:hypothetical protein